MIVDILPFRLKLASVQKNDLPRCTHQLMKLVLFPSGPQHFFSYTEAEKEVSLILDESLLSDFPEDTLDICNVIWRAVQIEPGESGLGSVDVVSQVSKCLAEANVSIMQISTYDADFTLMPECDLTRALDALSKTFTLANNPLEDANLNSSDLQSWDESFPMSPTEINSLQEALLLGPDATMVTTSMTRQRQASLTTGLLTEEDENALVGGQSHYPRHHHHHCSDMVGGGGGGGGRHVNGDSRNHHLHMHHLYHHHHHHRHHHGSGREDSGIGSEATSEPSSGVSSGHGSHVLDHQALGLDPTLISSLSLQERPDVDEDGDDLQSHQSSRDADDDDDDDNDDQDRASSSTDSKTTAATMFTSMRHKFQANHPHRLHITSLEQSLMGQLAIKLLESIFFDNRMDRFFSFTQTDTTLSIIMDDATLSLFPDNTLNTQAGSWRLISIGEGPLGFDECGIVSEFSRPLSEQGIGLFYLSTFKSDYIMVNDQDFDQAVEHLKETARRTSVSGSGAGSEPGSVASSPSLGSGSMAFEEVAAAEL